MSRALFKRWGSQLSPPDFACALAAVGVLEAAGQTALHSVKAYRGSDTPPPVPWKLGGILEPPSVAPVPLAPLWRHFVATRSQLRLEICEPWPPIDPIWLIEELSRPEVGAASVFLSKNRRPRDHWHWPLRMGFLADPQSNRLRETIEQQSRRKRWHKELTTFIDLGEQEPRCDLLVVPHGPRLALARTLELARGVHAVAALLIGPAGDSRSATIRLMRSIDEEVLSSAIAFITWDSGPVADWLDQLVIHLSHDLPFDLALMASLGPPSERPASVLMANAQWMREALVSELASTLDRKLSIPEIRTEKLLVHKRLATRLNIRRGLHPIAALPPINLLYDRESHGATTLALLTNDIRPKLRAVEPRSRRLLQARVYELVGPRAQKWEGPLEAFHGGGIHEIEVRVGLPDEHWVAGPVPFPEETLPPSKSGHLLTVIFIEPEFSPEPQVDHIFLPPAGSSARCTFELRPAADATEVNARITVAYKNRVLQTSTLRGPVVRASTTPQSDKIRFLPEVVVSPGMSDLDRQAAYGAALVFNHTNKNEGKVLKLVDDSAVLVSTGNLAEPVRRIEDALARADWGSKDYSGLVAKGTEKLLLALAAHGTLLYRGIVKNQFRDSQLAAADRIQLIAAKPDSRLPVEYFYELPSSPGATGKLCTEAAKVVNGAKCSAHCGAKADPEKYVCPFGFWGMTKVLEWHSFRPEAAGELGAYDFALQQERLAQRKQLKPLGGALIGASDRANRAVKNSVPALVNFVKKTKIPSHVVETWPEWKQCVKANAPTLLILLPHTETEANSDVAKMEIGTEQWLTVNQLTDAYVRSKAVQPIVLLLGCDTAQQHVTFEDFISNFCIGGAAIVVGSNATILGRQAAPLAQEFVDVLKQLSGQKNATFGDVMLAVRRNMMRKGYPIVLSISSYGDADWRL